MTKQELVNQLKSTDTLLPQDVLKDTSLKQLVAMLKKVFDENMQELEADVNFRNNFTELVNYVYVRSLHETPAKREKNPFGDRLIAFLLTPNPAL